eukprot:gene4631-8204_t
MDPTEETNGKDHPFHLPSEQSLFEHVEVDIPAFDIPSLSTTTHQTQILQTPEGEQNKYTLSKPVDKWSKEEHERFLEALKVNKDWNKIQEAVKTKTTVQIRSHAHKYFSKMKLKTTVNPSTLQKKPIGQQIPKSVPFQTQPNPQTLNVTSQNIQQPTQQVTQQSTSQQSSQHLQPQITNQQTQSTQQSTQNQSQTQQQQQQQPILQQQKQEEILEIDSSSNSTNDVVNNLNSLLGPPEALAYSYLTNPIQLNHWLANGLVGMGGLITIPHVNLEAGEEIVKSLEEQIRVGKVPTLQGDDDKTRLPNFKRIYAYLGTLFNPTTTNHSEYYRNLGNQDKECLKVLMHNLSIILSSQQFQDDYQIHIHNELQKMSYSTPPPPPPPQYQQPISKKSIYVQNYYPQTPQQNQVVYPQYLVPQTQSTSTSNQNINSRNQQLQGNQQMIYQNQQNNQFQPMYVQSHQGMDGEQKKENGLRDFSSSVRLYGKNALPVEFDGDNDETEDEYDEDDDDDEFE